MTAILYNVHKAEGQPNRSPEDLFPSLKTEPDKSTKKKDNIKKDAMSGQQMILHLMNNGFVPDRERKK